MRNSTLKMVTMVTIVLSTLILNSCKKSSDKGSPEGEDLREVYFKKLAGQPYVSSQILNIHGRGYYSDLNGNKITLLRTNSSELRETSCPEPGDSEFDQTFVSMDREFTCGVGYRFLVTYKITSEF